MARNVGTAPEVVEAFIDAALYPNRTASAPVPGGCRVHVMADSEGLALRSYLTTVAVRIAGRDAVALTPRRYSVTTSKLMSQLRGELARQGYRETAETVTVNARVPGRWGGYGPAWHATGWEALPFAVWTRPDWRERTASDGSRFKSSGRVFADYEARMFPPCPECGGPADTGAGHDCETR